MSRGAKVPNLGPIYTIFAKVSRVVFHICFDGGRPKREEITERWDPVGPIDAKEAELEN